MSVLVDTPIWSLLLRRQTAAFSEADRLRRLIASGEAQILGAIRQEVLSGIRHAEQFARVRDRLRAFPDILVGTSHHERAAELFSLARKHGIQGSNVDFLICAVAELNRLSIFTTDRDFGRFARIFPIQLLK